LSVDGRIGLQACRIGCLPWLGELAWRSGHHAAPRQRFRRSGRKPTCLCSRCRADDQQAAPDPRLPDLRRSLAMRAAHTSGKPARPAL